MTTSGTELARFTSTAAAPVAGTALASSDAPSIYLGDGTTLPKDLHRIGEPFRGAGPLSHIKKAQDSVYKIMMLGTSKQSFDSSSQQVFTEHLKTLFGDANVYQLRPGVIGGSFTSAFQGWLHQRYGGPFQYRLRADSTATPIVQTVYGDYVTLEFSIETDAAAAPILIDGTQVGTTPAGGAQTWSQAQTFTFSTIGQHTVSIGVPSGAGYVYWEHMTVGLQARRGVEVRDATLGGSLFSGQLTETAAAAATGQAATVPYVSPTVGLNAVFNRPDVDLFIVGYIVNDAGWQPSNMYNYNTYWKSGMDSMAAITAANGAKVILIVETAGSHIVPGGGARHLQYLAMADYYRRLAKKWPHITLVDHQSAIRPASYALTDLQAWANMYFPAAGTVNADGTYTGTDFIHDVPTNPTPTAQYLSQQIGTGLLCLAGGVQPPTRPLASYLFAERSRTILPAYRDFLATINGVAKKFPVASGGTWQARTTAGQVAYVPFFRDATPTNIAASTQTAIDASGTSDSNGTYLNMAGTNIGLGSSVAVGSRYMLTIRARGTIQIRAFGGAIFYSSYTGAQIPQTDVGNGRTDLNYTPTGTEPVAISAVVGATAINGYLSLRGDVFEVSLVNADTPVLTKNAPPVLQGPQGIQGPVGPVNQVGSSLVSACYSAPSMYGGLTANALTVNTLYFVPFVPLSSGNAAGLGINVTTAGASGSVLRLGLYASDSNNRPGTLLGEVTATSDASTTGWKTGTFSANIALTAGTLYWMAVVAQGGTPTVRSISGISPQVVIPSGAGDSQSYASYSGGGVSGALPTTPSPGGASLAPFVRLLAA